MITTNITTNHAFKTNNTSWELGEIISKYLKKSFKGYKNTSVACAADGMVVTVLNTTIPTATLEFIDGNIPRWAAEVNMKGEKENKEDMIAVKKFLKEFKMPVVKSSDANKKELNELLEVMEDFLADIKDGFKNGDPNVCRVGDIISYVELVNLLSKNRIKEAYKLYSSLDTDERECVPESIVSIFDA